MPATRLSISRYAFLLLAVLLLLFGLLNVFWFFVPPPGGLDAARARAVGKREAPKMRVTETRLDHCDRLMRTLSPGPQPSCGGGWAWLVKTDNTCRGVNSDAVWLLVDYQSGAIIYKQVCGLG